MKATHSEALVKLYNALNHPCKAGPKWVTYKRETVQACIDVTKQLAINAGAKVAKGPRKIEP